MTQPEDSTTPSGHKVGPCDIKITRPTPPYRHLGTTTTEVETRKKKKKIVKHDEFSGGSRDKFQGVIS